MKVLETQADFEALWFAPTAVETDEGDAAPWIVYFTAAWCKPCKKLDLDAICTAADACGVPIYKCDETVNEYTSGYCGVRSFPTFILFRPKTVLSTLHSSDTGAVIEWVRAGAQRGGT
jgi:hypothetical protein